ncbi:right-handed parallel beta-helix repeat-containing protein [Riemerella anatipestifer]|uniref:glycosyl hydrolase family 28-related protein n=1 Tax=Riemerella anatipestifer TaxID=34085 RepID=UPI0023640B1B|nr:glycosyl hydrolase family 28-related protein [Riemerella anatipestifer]MDD1596976.1 hypothetical protein [Riemerella anatipestifer]
MNLKIVFFLFFFTICNAQIYYNVKDFGAVSDDGKDDWLAFQNCIRVAIKSGNNPVIYVPNGVYNISTKLTFDYLVGSVNFVGEDVEGKKPILKFLNSNNESLVEARGYLFSPSKGVFNMKNIHIIGNNKPFSLDHPFANKNEWSAAVLVLDKKEVHLDSLIIQNHYGQGIHISTTQQKGINENSRFESVTITNTNIKDVWGHNPQLDNYGDAIYLSDVASAIIQQNIIFNNTSTTKQLGRAGIVIEYMSENIKILDNKLLGGYDRPLHIEATYGGHLIENNQFKGSDLGIVLAENLSEKFKPILFKNNLVTNEGLLKQMNLKKSYGSGNFGDRALVFIVTEGDSKKKDIKFIKNTFYLEDKYEYESNSLINNRSLNVSFEYNSFSSGKRKDLSIYNYGKGIFRHNSFSENVRVK